MQIELKNKGLGFASLVLFDRKKAEIGPRVKRLDCKTHPMVRIEKEREGIEKKNAAIDATTGPWHPPVGAPYRPGLDE